MFPLITKKNYLNFFDISLKIWQIWSSNFVLWQILTGKNKTPNIILSVYRKSFKKKLKKKVRFSRILKKLRKVKKHKIKYITKSFFSYSVSSKILSGKRKVLLERMFITQRTINENFLQMHYKLNKYTKFDQIKKFSTKTTENSFIGYLRNYDDKPYWALRTARIAHWSLFTNKTLREQRYQSFLKLFLRKYSSLAKPYIFIIASLTFRTVSWTRLRSLNNSFKNSLVVHITKNFLQIPIFFSKFINWSLFKKKNKKLKKIIGKWSYLKFKKFSLPWLQKKKNFPKIVKHICPQLSYFKLSSYYDPLTGYVYDNNLFEKKNLHVWDFSKINYLVKLHVYRYNPQ